ncbi:MAG: glycoside hydrolase family 5 protein [Sediminibacterium sp.]|nr:MAG: glycoside hydrolase family 5 protein [Sediminibacterium sp.]
MHKIPLLFYSVCLLFVGQVIAQGNRQPFGVNLCGAEFGLNHLPGTFGKDYIYPNNTCINYYAQKGIKLISLPFKWERIQPELNKPLSTAELNRLLEFIANCNKDGMQVLLTLQNFGRYSKNGVEYVLGSAQVSRKNFQDLWLRIATVLKDKKNIYGYDVMNEPHDMLPYCPWHVLAQDAIDAIRTVDDMPAIFINGNSYANSEKWYENNVGLIDLFDPSDKIIYEAHCYFDKDYSGRYIATCGDDFRVYDECEATEYTGIDMVRPFVDWLEKYHKKGFIGEYGVPNKDERWLVVLENFLNFLRHNKVNGTYWAGGPWWHDYKLSVEPKNGRDTPQMKVVEKFKYTN